MVIVRLPFDMTVHVFLKYALKHENKTKFIFHLWKIIAVLSKQQLFSIAR